MKKTKHKLKNSRGFTLIEMMTAVIVMLLVTQVITLTVRLSVKYYTSIVKTSESQTLCDSLARAVKDELSCASDVQMIDGIPVYYSRSRAYGAGCSIRTVEVSTGEGAVQRELAVVKDGQAYPLLGSQTYSFGMNACIECVWEDLSGFDVTISVLDQDNATVLQQQHFHVYPIAGTA